MHGAQPSLQDWQNLYRAATHFRQIHPWQWVNDTDLFGVKNPEDEEIGYCCVVGALGEFLGLIVYLGTEGLETYLKIQRSESPEEEVLGSGKCLVASFEDRKLLEKADHEVIRRLGLKFRGAKSWPLFRSYEPGYYPWYIEPQQARFLTHALQQVSDVSLRIKLKSNLLENSRDDLFLVRVPQQNGPDLLWRDAWLSPAPLQRPLDEVPVPDELRLQRIKKKEFKHAGTWEIDYSHIHFPIKEEGRPFFPLCLFIVDHDSGFVFKTHLESKDRHGPEFQKQMLDVIEELSLLPLEIWVKRDEVFRLFEGPVSRLGLKMKQVKQLKQLEQARKAMESHFSRM